MHDFIFFDAVGDHVIKATSGFKECILCSPFVKLSALKTILKNADTSATIVLVTKIDLDAFAQGVSDFAVLEEILSLGGRLFALQNLHVKYYRFDQNVFVGSANLTDKGMGWSEYPNFELLINRSLTEEEIGLEKKVSESAIELDEQSVEAIGKLVDQYKTDREIIQKTNNGSLVKQFEDILNRIAQNRDSFQFPEQLVQSWVPESFIPKDQLYEQYAGAAKDEDLPKDLLNLGFRRGNLNREGFERQIQQRLRQTINVK